VFLNFVVDTLESLHRFHPYCARFPSEVVEAAITQYTKPSDSVFDPFCGSGTTLVTSLAHRRKVTGTDIDTLAGMLSEVKCAPYAPEQYAKWRKKFSASLAKALTKIAQAWKPSSAPATRGNVVGRIPGTAPSQISLS
jgi:DNA methylase